MFRSTKYLSNELSWIWTPGTTAEEKALNFDYFCEGLKAIGLLFDDLDDLELEKDKTSY